MALSEVYAYHRRTEPMMANVTRDAPVHHLAREMAEPYFQLWERLQYVLVTGWGVEDERLSLLCWPPCATPSTSRPGARTAAGLERRTSHRGNSVGMVQCLTHD